MVKFGELYYYILDENTACVGENIFASGDIVIPEKIEVDGKQYTVTRIDDAAFCGHMDVWSETPETRRIERLKAKIGAHKMLKSVVMPNTITEIGGGAFSGLEAMTSITLSTSLKSIGQYAFSSCTGLTSITLPESLICIEDSAFCRCLGLTSITLPKSLSRIEDSAFNGCKNLVSFSVHPDNNLFCVVDGVLFTKNKKHLIAYPCNKPGGSYIVPEEVTHIEEAAFSNCSNLSCVTLPASLLKIKDYAFSRCSDLNEIHCLCHFCLLNMYKSLFLK
jgi:hypothetical protein